AVRSSSTAEPASCSALQHRAPIRGSTDRRTFATGKRSVPQPPPVLPVPARPTGAGDSEEQCRTDASEHTAADGPEYRYPGVTPVVAALVLDRQHGVCQAGAQVACGVDGVPGGAAQAGADTHP